MKKIIVLSILIFSFLGIIKIFSIVPLNRMAGDDYSSAIMGRLGLVEDIKQTYIGFMGRFSAVLFETPFSTSLAYNGKTTFYSIVTFFLLLISIIFFLKNVFNLNKNNLYLYLIGLMFFVLLYVFTPNKQESWYWLTGSIVYLWPIIIFLFSLSLFFKEKVNKIDLFILFLSTFLSAGFNETFSLFSIFISLVLFIYYFKNKEKKKLAIIMLCSTVIAFSIMYLAPGNEARKSSYGSKPMSYFGSMLYSLGEGPKYIMQMIKENITLFISSLFMLTFFISNFIPVSKEEKNDIYNVPSNIFVFLIIVLFLSFLYMMPSYAGLGRVQPERSAVSLSFLIVITLLYVSFQLSKIVNTIFFKKNIYNQLFLLFPSLVLVFSGQIFTINLAPDFYIAKNYAQHFDVMIDKFKEIAKSDDPYKVIQVSLPDSGLIAQMIDPPHVYSYKNLSLSQYYNIGKVESVEYENKN